MFMCRFNLILIKDEKAAEYLEARGYRKICDSLDGYMAYEKGVCNCGSFVGSLTDKSGMEYNAAIALCKKEKLERLYQIKELMCRPDYKERKDKFQRMVNQLSDELKVFYESVGEYGPKRTDNINDKDTGAGLDNQTGELYGKAEDMISALEEQPGYRKKRVDYADYIQENEIMNDSAIYYLTEEEEKKAEVPGIPLSDLLGPEVKLKLGEMEELEFKKESMVIGEVISRTEKDTYENNLKEYQNYFRLFTGLLKYARSFSFATIWSEPGELKKVKTVNIDSIKIDDLAFLEFDQRICITR